MTRWPPDLASREESDFPTSNPFFFSLISDTHEMCLSIQLELYSQRRCSRVELVQMAQMNADTSQKLATVLEQTNKSIVSTLLDIQKKGGISTNGPQTGHVT